MMLLLSYGGSHLVSPKTCFPRGFRIDVGFSPQLPAKVGRSFTERLLDSLSNGLSVFSVLSLALGGGFH